MHTQHYAATQCRTQAKTNVEEDKVAVEGARAQRARLQELSGAVQRHRACTEEVPRVQQELAAARAADAELQSQARPRTASLFGSMARWQVFGWAGSMRQSHQVSTCKGSHSDASPT